MQIVSSNLIKGKRVLLRYDMDVGLKKMEDGGWKVEEEFRLKAGLETLRLCSQYGGQVIMMGHVGRPKDEDPNLSVEPIYDWFYGNGFKDELENKKLRILENLRFESGEDEADLEYARELASYGEFYVNEAFAAHHKAASTTVLPTLFPHVKDPEGRLRPRRAAGLHFAKEVATLTKVRENPQRPLVVIIGGVKIEDKLPAIKAMLQIADNVLVGGKIAETVINENLENKDKLHIAKLNELGTDITQESVAEWQSIISEAKEILFNGPLVDIEDPKNDSTRSIAHIVINSGARTILGGGDTVKAIDSYGLLDKFSFISTGGGAMLKFLSEGTLLTIDALE